MIESNELRIGNLVTYLTRDRRLGGPLYRKVGSVTSIHKSNFTIDNRIAVSKEVNLHNCKPIELNDERLKRCGLYLARTLPDQWQIPNSIYSIIPETTLAAGKWSFIVFNALAGYLTYVHQLQNIFHSLTGQELEINLNDI
jgi:hypothetical protein